MWEVRELILDLVKRSSSAKQEVAKTGFIATSPAQVTEP
jgi:hypothetical protein